MWQIEGNQFNFSITESMLAPRQVVYDVLADFETYPDFISDIVSARREGDVYRMVVKAAILTIPARIRVEEDPGREVAFELVEGPVDVLTGKWLVEEAGKPGETQVTLSVHMEAGERSEWLLRMSGKFVQSKTGKLVEAFRQRIEAVHRGEVSPAATRREEGGLAAALRRLWAGLTGKSAGQGAPARVFTDPHQVETLEALASTMIPPDDFDGGAAGLGFPEVAEVRSRYEKGRSELYLAGLRAVDKLARDMFGKDTFASLTLDERTSLLDAVRQGTGNGAVWGKLSPGDFFGALWEDVLFLYCTHPDTWQRLGWPGPSFDAGGYADFAQTQTFTGKTHA